MELDTTEEFIPKVTQPFIYQTSENKEQLYSQNYPLPQQQMIKEDIFKITEEENTGFVSYGDQPYIPLSNDTSKPCFKLLYSLNIPVQVKQKVEEKILTSGKRASSFTAEIMCALVITAYGDLGLDVDLEGSIRMFGLDPFKSKVMQLISKATTKSTIISQQETSIHMVIIKPSTYIIEIFNSYIIKFNIIFNNKDYVINKIKELTETLEQYYPTIDQLFPRETASVIIYLYLKGNITNTTRGIFTETIFSELPLVVKSKFKKILKPLESIFIDFSSRYPQLYLSFYH
jgi:hypothetical protein